MTCSRTLLRRLVTDGLLADHRLEELTGMPLYVRIGELADGAAGAGLCGALDSWEACPPADVEPGVRAGLGSGLASVRLRALDVLARTGRRDEAVALARDDGAAQVRRRQPPADALARTPDQPTLLG